MILLGPWLYGSAFVSFWQGWTRSKENRPEKTGAVQSPHPGPIASRARHKSGAPSSETGFPERGPIRWEREIDRGVRRNPGRRSCLAGPGLFSFILTGFTLEPAWSGTEPELRSRLRS